VLSVFRVGGGAAPRWGQAGRGERVVVVEILTVVRRCGVACAVLARRSLSGIWHLRFYVDMLSPVRSERASPTCAVGVGLRRQRGGLGTRAEKTKNEGETILGYSKNCR
jgi:hypothetical protein